MNTVNALIEAVEQRDRVLLGDAFRLIEKGYQKNTVHYLSALINDMIIEDTSGFVQKYLETRVGVVKSSIEVISKTGVALD